MSKRSRDQDDHRQHYPSNLKAIRHRAVDRALNTSHGILSTRFIEGADFVLDTLTADGGSWCPQDVKEAISHLFNATELMNADATDEPASYAILRLWLQNKSSH